ncbi:PhzF family phenazine biosynthesis protein [Paenibacillus phyllosphaerae]|uniref:PhzF family phenazine biosynthesis protein n=1 Tax=Paenibacillus phyllosphaerae TaxID=274593 RepID=A0A7W5FM78_9BACL|nr:PhzF family phenazine biosynthesis protein [Paenibacillus phyllosphaerae]MBB3110005.1 PhzF family phenazine biosynthesis protein [Paenibacillus phyllosphaerae]
MSALMAIIDAFASDPFKGNPAAVCLLEEERPDDWMQAVAQEMNLSETAFLVKREDGYSLRWFTPSTEVDLCGHATLASAHFVWEHGLLDRQVEGRFHTRSGLLTARYSDEGITLHFPIERGEPAVAPEELIQALGLIPRYVSLSRMGYMVEVDSETTVRTLVPDLALIAQLPVQAVIVTSRGASQLGSPYDFVSRVFLPSIGIDEDPVTGSAHCLLASYWEKRLRKNEFLAYQASPRGGELRVRVDGENVTLLGQAVTIMSGRLRI